MADDTVRARLRAVEREIDEFYKANPLLRDGRATAVWTLLGVAEDWTLRPALQRGRPTGPAIEALTDGLNHALKPALAWINSDAAVGVRLDTRLSESRYGNAAALLNLAHSYTTFQALFTYWSASLVGLDLRGNRIVPDLGALHNQPQYEAYCLLTTAGTGPVDPFSSDLLEAIGRGVRINGDRFTVRHSPQLFARVLAELLPMFAQEYTLPGHWRFSRYSLADLRAFCQTMAAFAFLRHLARIEAIERGCPALGFRDALVVCSPTDLVHLAVRYAGINYGVVKEILADLTYGNRGIIRPDPLLQPFVTIDDYRIAFSPHLWLTRSSERNHSVLVNRIPEDRAIYERLTQEKELRMREELEASLESGPFRTVTCTVPCRADLPDIDLAIVSDKEKLCLIVELKWFIDPADIRECLQKGDELKNGIRQVSRLVEAVQDDFENMGRVLGIDRDFEVTGVVVSFNWIGTGNVQDPHTPIVSLKHFCRKVRDSSDLESITHWLGERRYLPIEGEDFLLEKPVDKIGKWEAEWYGFKFLKDELFSPL